MVDCDGYPLVAPIDLGDLEELPVDVRASLDRAEPLPCGWCRELMHVVCGGLQLIACDVWTGKRYLLVKVINHAVPRFPLLFNFLSWYDVTKPTRWLV